MSDTPTGPVVVAVKLRREQIFAYRILVFAICGGLKSSFHPEPDLQFVSLKEPRWVGYGQLFSFLRLYKSAGYHSAANSFDEHQ